MKRTYHFSAETNLTAVGVNGAAIIIKSKIFHNRPLSLMFSISYGGKCKQAHVYSRIKLNRSVKEQNEMNA